MSARRRAFLACCALAATGCATVLNGSAQQVEIRTTPPGATAVILPDGARVETPAEIDLPRKEAHTVRLRLEGHCPETAYLDRVTSSAIYGNLLIGGLLGLLIDSDTGGAFRLTPDPLEVELRPLDATRSEDACRLP